MYVTNVKHVLSDSPAVARWVQRFLWSSTSCSWRCRRRASSAWRWPHCLCPTRTPPCRALPDNMQLPYNHQHHCEFMDIAVLCLTTCNFHTIHGHCCAFLDNAQHPYKFMDISVLCLTTCNVRIIICVLGIHGHIAVLCLTVAIYNVHMIINILGVHLTCGALPDTMQRPYNHQRPCNS